MLEVMKESPFEFCDAVVGRRDLAEIIASMLCELGSELPVRTEINAG